MFNRESFHTLVLTRLELEKMAVSEIFTFLNTYTQVCVFDYVGTTDLLSGINCRNKGI